MAKPQKPVEKKDATKKSRRPHMKGKNKIAGVSKVMKTWPGYSKLVSGRVE